MQTLMSYAVGGDSSNWIGAFGMTHYNMEDMPGIALGVALHLAQMMRSKRFMLYDFGNAKGNLQAYGTPQPLDVGANYGVIDIPIDVVAGTKDKLIPKAMVARHYQHLKDGGVKASYSEFEYAHLDFTFSNKDAVLDYIMTRLLLVRPNAHVKLKRRFHRSKTAKEARRREWGQLTDGQKGFYTESSRSKSLVHLRQSEDGDNTHGEEQQSSRGRVREDSEGGDHPYEEEELSSSGRVREDSVTGDKNRSAGTGLLPREEVQEEAAGSSGRNPSEPLQDLDSNETCERMSYQDAHATARKFVNDFPKSGFAMKDVMSSFRSRSSLSKSSSSSGSAHRSENPQQQSLSSGREGNDSESNQPAPNSVVEVLQKPSGLRRLRIPRFGSSIKKGLRQTAPTIDLKAL